MLFKNEIKFPEESTAQIYPEALLIACEIAGAPQKTHNNHSIYEPELII